MKENIGYFQYRVPYADTDKMGIVYYGNYLTYFEIARCELMRSIGYSYSDLEADGYALPIIEAVCRYKASARFEDLLTLSATFSELKGVRMKISCEVKCGDKLLAEGYTMHACLFGERDKMRPARAPKRLLEILELSGNE